MIRRLIPSKIKKKIRIIQRNNADKKSGIIKEFAEKAPHLIKEGSIQSVQLQQPIYYNPLAANKVTNIGIAIREIHEVPIATGEVFSLWHILGNPTTEKGYKTGRNLINNELKEDVGGGLCQVAGLTYHLALIAGMTILERHAHTLDLYEEDKRYTPLGADAAVVHGYKDLRFKNNLNDTVWFEFSVKEDSFSGAICSNAQLKQHTINFERKELENYRTINTYRNLANEQAELVNASKYKLSLK